jgi:ATP-dependent helicase Lhr and Lhr-like helicase
MESLPAPFGPATRAWFADTFPTPTPVQRRGWASIAAGKHSLLLAPTGSGKTLAAFLWCLDQLSGLPGDAPPGVRVVYVSPLKALVHDVERNLRAPLMGLRRASERLGIPAHETRIDLRTGDTSQKDRRAQARRPGEILVTTPESLYLLLGSQARETLRTVEWIVIDEIHALAATKRGVHLALSLERLSCLAAKDPQRIGLSATVRPLDEVARFLGGDRPVAVVDTVGAPALDLEVVVPVEDLDQPGEAPPLPERADAEREEAEPELDEGVPLSALEPGSKGLDGDLDAQSLRRTGIWPHLHGPILEQIQAHRSTIVFVNSRLLCERLTQHLNDLAGEELVRAHHGSLSHARRAEVEDQLKAGTLRGLVATSSLELGIDMGAVDLVILVESPGAVARGLQRAGRAGHQVNTVSRVRVFPKYKGDLLEAATIARAMRSGDLEPLRVPRRCLDVLAQQITSMCVQRDWPLDDLERVIQRAYPYRELPRSALIGVLDMLAGRYPSDAFADLRPVLNWDRRADLLKARRGARLRVALNPGTIPDRGTYAVHLGEGGPRLGELDEEMVFETRRGETFVLGASSWRVLEVTRDRVLVEPAPGEPGKLPFWRGQGPGRPVELGRAIGALLRELESRDPEEGASWLREECQLDELAAKNLVELVADQREATGVVPSDRGLLVERFRDELGDWRICLLSPLGSRVHAPWALAIEASLRLRSELPTQVLWTDDGIVLRVSNTEEAPDLELLFPEADEVEELVVEQLQSSAMFAAQFRENAARALLLPRRRPGARSPLWAQRLRSETLLNAAAAFPAFPMILETYRECLQDRFDLPTLIELLRDVSSGDLKVDEVETSYPSPFARSLTFGYVAAFMYQEDSPLAERRAQALTLDRALLRELLGEEELRSLLDPGVLTAYEAELAGAAEGRRCKHADALHDLLRRCGDLCRDEVAARCEGDPEEWLALLESERRAVQLKIGGEARWIAAEDAGRYRDALGCFPPAGLPSAFLEPRADALESLLLRWARRRGPFLSEDPALRFSLPSEQVEALLSGLEERGLLVRGAFRPGGVGREWAHREVLRELRRRSLAKLRRAVAPVDGRVLTRFLCRWQGVRALRPRKAPRRAPPATPRAAGARGANLDRLRDVIEQLEGLALPFSVLEREILPARVAGYRPSDLDELGNRGELIWVGAGARGPRDGKVALYLRERFALLRRPSPPLTEPSALQTSILESLDRRGATFLPELLHDAGSPSSDLLLPALWELVWAGLVSNDTLTPLRILAGSKRKARSRRRRRPSLRTRDLTLGGRWVLLDRVAFGEPSETERAHALATSLLERYGIVSRDAAKAEAIPGGFASLYGVYGALEERGSVRRGQFAEGLTGAQFALPGAVDRLRAEREPGLEPQGLHLAALDPANPYGSLLPWPEVPEGAPRPARRVHCSLTLVDGAPVLYWTRDLKTAISFPAAQDPDLLGAALNCVLDRHPEFHLATLDGEPARGAALAPAFEQAGFVPSYLGLSATRGRTALPAAQGAEGSS